MYLSKPYRHGFCGGQQKVYKVSNGYLDKVYFTLVQKSHIALVAENTMLKKIEIKKRGKYFVRFKD